MAIELQLPARLQKALEREANDARRTLHAHIVRKLENITPQTEFMKPELIQQQLPMLIEFLNRIPAVEVTDHQATPDAYWGVKLDIDIAHPLAWNVVQALGFVLNDISLTEKLPTVFMPISPPPYLNGGPAECLSWIIETKFNYIYPQWIQTALEERLPHPVNELGAWSL